ncbi:Uncharacterized protein dnl_28350 [Desulfonema limicola]|uniref:Uncharacterized protein n=1 Tax=Desulfonema limicola TaxID=45656 RepID=A0A975B7Y2_9BACT|nr:Uncharacterized protein dnl_28350 [Desulfonema limicola]
MVLFMVRKYYVYDNIKIALIYQVLKIFNIFLNLIFKL